MLRLLSEFQFLRNKAQFVGQETELVPHYIENVNLLEWGRWPHSRHQKLSVEGWNVEPLTVEVDHYICFIQQLVHPFQHLLWRGLKE